MPAANIDVIDLEFPKDPFRPSPGSVSENWFDYRTDTLWIGADTDNIHRAASHEMAHLLLHASTPYGLFLNQLAKLQSAAGLRYCAEVIALKDPIRYPIYDFAKQ